MLVDGDPVVYLERGGKSIRTLPAFADAETAALALRALAGLVVDGRMRSLQVARIDGVPIAVITASRRARGRLASRPDTAGFVLGGGRGRERRASEVARTLGLEVATSGGRT